MAYMYIEYVFQIPKMIVVDITIHFEMFMCFWCSQMLILFSTETKIKAAAKYIISFCTPPSNGKETWHE